MTPNEAACKAQLDSETRLQPGETGWWRVYGARAFNVLPGDIIISLVDGELLFDEVADVIVKPTATTFVKPMGETFRIGNLFNALIVERLGTGNFLA